MMGFVAALSSSISLIVLIMIAQLINIISIASNQDLSGGIIVKTNDKLESVIAVDKSDPSVKASYYLTPEVAAAIGPHKEIVLYCEYGNNINRSTAEKIVSYNYILLKKAQPDTTITIKKPEFSADKHNVCKINYED